MSTYPKNDNSLGVGSLAYIPSQARLIKYDSDGVASFHENLNKPVVVPIVGIENDRVSHQIKVHYRGEIWWASDKDLYEVSENSLGSSIK
jgi:hypothetical protein